MIQIIFKINYGDDANNFVRLAKLVAHPFGSDINKIVADIPLDLLVKLRELDRPAAKEAAEQYLLSIKDKILPELEIKKEILEKYFDQYGVKIFTILSKLVGKEIYTDKFYCSFTLLGSAPYNYKNNWFMVSCKRPLANQVNGILHEILHLQFHHDYEEYCKEQGLSEQQFQDLKEALTFLLNEPVFAEFSFGPDRGYINHQKLRQLLKELYDQDHDFKKFLDKAIKLVREAY